MIIDWGVPDISVTASPTPQNLASSSMPSSQITVLSTSKHTASAQWNSATVSETVSIEQLEDKKQLCVANLTIVLLDLTTECLGTFKKKKSTYQQILLFLTFIWQLVSTFKNCL